MRYVVFEFPASTGGNECNRSAPAQSEQQSTSENSALLQAVPLCQCDSILLREYACSTTVDLALQLSSRKLLVGSKFYVNRDPGNLAGMHKEK